MERLRTLIRKAGPWLGAALLCAVVWWAWMRMQPAGLPAGIVGGNGRLESVELDVAAKTPGRIKAVRVQEGDMVTAGQVVAEMATESLEAEMERARALVRQARNARLTAQAMVSLREQTAVTAAAMVTQRQSQLALAEKDLARAHELVERRFIAPQKLDESRTQVQSAKALLDAAGSQLEEASQAIAAARSQQLEAASAIEAAEAGVRSLQTQLDDSLLRAPRAGRVQVRAAQDGEVVAAGARIVSLVDLSDVTMNFFLPETAAGRVAIGSDVRIVLDAAPEFVIPATISFVASVAQFTPKTVETTDERNKMVFRVRARVAPELLRQHSAQVKTGLPGMAYVRTQAGQEWPARFIAVLPPIAP